MSDSRAPIGSTRAEIVDWARAVYEDLDFGLARSWLAEHPGSAAAGFLPVYAPREVIRAAGMLPIAIYGGGDQLEIIRGDAFYQSYICHLPRSVIELAQSGRLDFLSAMLFPSTCDVIRNLSGVWQVLYPSLYVRYLDLPQVADAEMAIEFWAGELRTLWGDLCRVAGTVPEPDALRAAIAAGNEFRGLVRSLYAMRRERPWSVPSEELYVLLRACEVAPHEIACASMRAYRSAVEADPGRPRDKSRVIVIGAFCEQPPLGLIKTLERAGCAIVDDDFLIGNRLIEGDVAQVDDPARDLAEALVRRAVKTSVLYEPDPEGKRTLVKRRVDAARADGVIFAAPSFCDPALLDRPMLRAGADAHGIACIGFKYAENSGQFQQFREQAGTFSDSIKLWGGREGWKEEKA
jgi:benzoyl-CoA reductase subunit C